MDPMDCLAKGGLPLEVIAIPWSPMDVSSKPFRRPKNLPPFISTLHVDQASSAPRASR